MLPKKNRLSRQDIAPLIKAGRRIHAPHMSLVYQKSATPRFAVVVSKKIAKTAVARNRMRRRTYALLREHISSLPVEGMFIMQKGAQTLSLKDLQAEASLLIKKLCITIRS